MKKLIIIIFLFPCVAFGQSKYIPELQPADVYLNLENVGFTTTKDLGTSLGNFWTSTLKEGGIKFTVEISSDSGTKIQSIQATVINSNYNPAKVKQFFKYMASMLFLYNNRSNSSINNWIDNNFNNDGAVTSVGSVKVKISAPSNIIRIITIDANLNDGV